VKLHGEAAQQPGAERRARLGQRGERLAQQPDDRRVRAALLDPPAAQAQRRAGEVLTQARRPCELRRSLEGAAAVIEIAGLGGGCAEAEQQLAAGRVVGDFESSKASRARSKWPTASSYASEASARRAALAE
jgi:hypothetical protein